MDLIDREQLMNYIRSKKINIGKLAHDIIMKQESVNAVSEEVYTEEFNLRKDTELKVYKLEKALEQEPKTGHWITWKEAGNEIASETRFECSVCHDSAQTLCNGLDLLSPYCPNCGAKMEVKENDT